MVLKAGVPLFLVPETDDTNDLLPFVYPDWTKLTKYNFFGKNIFTEMESTHHRINSFARAGQPAHTRMPVNMAGSGLGHSGSPGFNYFLNYDPLPSHGELM